MTSRVPVDRRPATAFLPLSPGDEYDLRHGRPWRPGADLARLNRRGVDQDGVPLGWTGAYKYQSDRDLVFRLTRAAMAQGVWSLDEVFTHLTAHTGGAWLLAREDAWSDFEDVVADVKHVGAPQHTVDHVVRVVLEMSARPQGVRRCELVAALAVHVEGRDEETPYNNGDLNKILDQLRENGFTSETTKIGPRGKVVARWIYRTAVGAVDSIVAHMVKAASERMAKIKGRRHRVAQTSPEDTTERASTPPQAPTREHPTMATKPPAGLNPAELGSVAPAEPEHRSQVCTVDPTSMTGTPVSAGRPRSRTRGALSRLWSRLRRHRLAPRKLTLVELETIGRSAPDEDVTTMDPASAPHPDTERPTKARRRATLGQPHRQQRRDLADGVASRALNYVVEA